MLPQKWHSFMIDSHRSLATNFENLAFKPWTSFAWWFARHVTVAHTAPLGMLLQPEQHLHIPS